MKNLPAEPRIPAIYLPYGAEVEEILGVALGRVDSYDFHALEEILDVAFHCKCRAFSTQARIARPFEWFLVPRYVIAE